jgi:hypothetical protein
LKGDAAPSPPRAGTGDVNAPAGTTTADAIVVFARDNDARLSHDSAAAAGTRSVHQIAITTASTTSATLLTCLLLLRIPSLLPVLPLYGRPKGLHYL